MRCVVFDLESVLLADLATMCPADGAVEVLARCFSRYRLAAVSASADGNVAVKNALEATDWGSHIEVVVTPREITGPAAFRAVCAATGTQTQRSVLVTSRPEAALEANQAGLGVVMVAEPLPDLARSDSPAVAVDCLDDVPAAILAMGGVWGA